MVWHCDVLFFINIQPNLFIDEECQEMDEDAKRNKNVRERGVSCFNEALPILQYICSKLDEAQK